MTDEDMHISLKILLFYSLLRRLRLLSMYLWWYNPRNTYPENSVTLKWHYYFPTKFLSHACGNLWMFWGKVTFHIEQQNQSVNNMGAWRGYLKPPLNHMALQNSLSFTREICLCPLDKRSCSMSAFGLIIFTSSAKQNEKH